MDKAFVDYVQDEVSTDHPIFDRLIGGIDATKLSEFVERKKPVPSTIVWFQCPWTCGDVSDLIQRVVKNVAKFQTTGDKLLIGLVTLTRYYESYREKEITSTAQRHGYVCSTDEELIKKCIEYGYRHWSDAISSRDFKPLGERCHNSFAGSHVTRIFTSAIFLLLSVPC